MKVALFIPCYVNQFYPEVGIATLQLLERLGCEVAYPEGQTCCGQPLANTGLAHEAAGAYRHFTQTFQGYEYIVTPSASCTHHVRHHFDTIDQTPAVKEVRSRIFDLTEFLVDELQVKQLSARFPYRVGLHRSCHGLRGMRMAKCSEQAISPFSKWEFLLSMVDGIELVDLNRRDECCGFGGTFAVSEQALSVKMGKDRLSDHLNAEAEFITSGDMSCLMHLEGIARRNHSPIRTIHLAEILNHTI
ncbi:(Fe-S)-binding protein [Pontibacter sp. G13]|uniref:(Fe-S)-binding protein n=1 Tax=Pontibacter sp. G13 TaxID=3074898 RepID=UPI002889299E|nr:(Fe-S)-binding protein [Pontibacter sp. G13]WNJ19021.1 (Fe-S)-binding protein [Pontibacter sp. G13]